MNWQPIETAPKDQSILVAGGDYWCLRFNEALCPQRTAVIARWYIRNGTGRWEVDGTETSEYYPDFVTATHWMPVPVLPDNIGTPSA